LLPVLVKHELLHLSQRTSAGARGVYLLRPLLNLSSSGKLWQV
jgi:hypothetical protein